MKFLLLSIFVATCFGANLDAQPADLFTVARQHQNLSQKLEDDISRELLLARTTISEVLRTSSDLSLRQVERFHGKILEYHNEAREAIAELNITADYCLSFFSFYFDNFLRTFEGQSSNILRSNNRTLIALTNEVKQDLEKYGDLLADVKSMVANAFISARMFTVPQKIIEKIEQQYKAAQENWNEGLSDISEVLVNFKVNIEKQNEELANIFSSAEENVKRNIEKFIAELDDLADVCK
jgi:hypothetical protein